MHYSTFFSCTLTFRGWRHRLRHQSSIEMTPDLGLMFAGQAFDKVLNLIKTIKRWALLGKQDPVDHSDIIPDRDLIDWNRDMPTYSIHPSLNIHVY